MAIQLRIIIIISVLISIFGNRSLFQFNQEVKLICRPGGSLLLCANNREKSTAKKPVYRYTNFVVFSFWRTDIKTIFIYKKKLFKKHYKETFKIKIFVVEKIALISFLIINDLLIIKIFLMGTFFTFLSVID